MLTRIKPFANLSAGELMSRPVETIPEEMSLREAACLLGRSRISGAPVVDAQGRCIGVLSATDFVRAAERGGKADAVHSTARPCVCADWQVVDLEFLPNDEVRWYMTSDPVTTTADTRITELARMLLDAHIHRVVIVDSSRRPIGIVTSTDILAAVVHLEDRK